MPGSLLSIINTFHCCVRHSSNVSSTKYSRLTRTHCVWIHLWESPFIELQRCHGFDNCYNYNPQCTWTASVSTTLYVVHWKFLAASFNVCNYSILASSPRIHMFYAKLKQWNIKCYAMDLYCFKKESKYHNLKGYTKSRSAFWAIFNLACYLLNTICYKIYYYEKNV